MCIFDHAGCDAPSRCATKEPVECRAASPVATCDGAPYFACRDAWFEVPRRSRADAP